MRITGGELRGRQVRVPPGRIRPSMDKMRESVFAALGDLTGCSFLDLFSGTGVIAIEAASRGAAHIEAVEADPFKRKVIIENVSISPVRINCHFMAVELYIQRARHPFDIVFIDPPFPYKYKWELLSQVACSPAVSNESKILLHRPNKDIQMNTIKTLERTDSREYGRSVVDFFKVIKENTMLSTEQVIVKLTDLEITAE